MTTAPGTVGGPEGTPDEDRFESTVSVILPVKNRADVVEEAIESVLAQKHRDLELILIDDGSTDGTRAILDGTGDPRVKVIENSGAPGVSGARNAGIDLARGRYLAFQDSDDTWDPTKLEKQIAHLRHTQATVSPRVGVSCCRGRIDGMDIVEGPPFGQGPYDRLDLLTGSVRERTPLLLLDRTVISDTARFDPEMPAVVERDYLLSVMSEGALLVGSDEELVTIRRGRTDHVAQPTRAAAAYQRYIVKYRADLDENPDMLGWYRFQAMRESLRARDRRQAMALFPEARRSIGWRALPHLVVGLTGWKKALSGMQVVLPVNPPLPAAGRATDRQVSRANPR